MESEYITLFQTESRHTPQRGHSAQSDNRINCITTNNNNDNHYHDDTKSSPSEKVISNNRKSRNTENNKNNNTKLIYSRNKTRRSSIIPLRVYNTNGEYFDTEMDSRIALHVLQFAIEDYFKVKVELQLLMHNRQQLNPAIGLAENNCKLLKGDPYVKLVFSVKRGPVLNLICHISRYHNVYIPLACHEMSLVYELKEQLSAELRKVLHKELSHNNATSNVITNTDMTLPKRQKQKGKNKNKWAAHHLRLFWRYNELNDRASIHSYGIPTNSVIEVTLKTGEQAHRQASSLSSYMSEASETIKPLSNRFKEPFTPQPLTYNIQDYMSRQERTQIENSKLHAKVTSKQNYNTTSTNNNTNSKALNEQYRSNTQTPNANKLSVEHAQLGRSVYPLDEKSLPNTPHHEFNNNNNTNDNTNTNSKQQEVAEYYRQMFNYSSDSSTSESHDEWTFDQTRQTVTNAPMTEQQTHNINKHYYSHLQEKRDLHNNNNNNNNNNYRENEPVTTVVPPQSSVPFTLPENKDQIKELFTLHHTPSHYSNVKENVYNSNNSNSNVVTTEMLNETVRALQRELSVLRAERQQLAHLHVHPSLLQQPINQSVSTAGFNYNRVNKEHELFLKATDRIAQLERAVDHLHGYLQRAISLIEV